MEPRGSYNNKLKYAIFIIAFIVQTWQVADHSYFLRGWRKIKIPDSHAEKVLISPTSHSLLVVDSYSEVLTLFPEGFNDLSLHETHNLSDEINLYGNTCFFNDDKTIIAILLGTVSIYDLDTGTIESEPEILNALRVFDCTTLNNGDLLITAEQGLIFKDPQGWHKTDFPWLVGYFLSTEDENGIIWLLDHDGDIFSYDRELDHITYEMNVWFQPPVRELLESMNLDTPYSFSGFERIPGEGFLILPFPLDISFILSTENEVVSIIELPEFRSRFDCNSYYVNRDSGQLFIMTESDIYQYNREDLQTGLYSRRYKLPDTIRCIAVDPSRQILAVLTDYGLYYREIKE
jgi:hypothetical protein